MKLDSYLRVKRAYGEIVHRMPVPDTLDYVNVSPDKYTDTLTNNVKEMQEDMLEDADEKNERPMQIMYDAVFNR